MVRFKYRTQILKFSCIMSDVFQRYFSFRCRHMILWYFPTLSPKIAVSSTKKA